MSITTADDYLLQSSSEASVSTINFKKKVVSSVLDLTPNSYGTGIISHDLASIANSNAWTDFGNSYINPTFQVQLEITAGASTFSTTQQEGGIAPKGSMLSLIDSLNLFINNQQVETAVRRSIPTRDWILHKRFSESQSILTRDSLAMMDEPYTPVFNDATVGVQCNDGETIAAKMRLHNSIPDGSMDTAAKRRATSRSQYAVSANQKQLTYTWESQLPLGLLSEALENLGLIKGAWVKFDMLTHNGLQFRVTTSEGSNAVTPHYEDLTSLVNPLGYNPLLLGPLRMANGTSTQPKKGLTFDTLANNTEITITLTLQKSTTGIVGGNNYSSVNSGIYCNVIQYTMNPEIEQRYLEEATTTTVFHSPFLLSITNAVNDPGTFDQVVSTASTNTKYLLLKPYRPAISTGVPALSQLNSPFVGYSDPYHIFTRFNILKNGSQIYQRDLLMGYEFWVNELKSAFAVNGGNSEITSGLISRDAWEKSPVYVVDLERDDAASSGLPASVQLQIVNDSNGRACMDCFLYTEKSLTLDKLTGKIVV